MKVVSFSDSLQAPRFITQPSASGSIVAEGRTKILQCQALGNTSADILSYRAVDPDPRLFSLLDPDPHLFSLLNPDPRLIPGSGSRRENFK